jgi:hypothetical protein
MFHKAKTEADRQRIFDEYFLNLLKKKQNIKRHQKIIDNSSSNFDVINQDKSSKGVFNSFVDSLVIKNFLIEQLYTRLKLNKNVVQSFVNKLNSNDILIMNKTLNEYIQYIKDNYQNANDYILTSSFNELKKNYNVKQLQEKNKEIITQNQEETNDTIRDAVSGDNVDEAARVEEKKVKKAVGGVEETKGEAEDTVAQMVEGERDKETADDVSRLSDDEEGATEEIKATIFLQNTVFKLQGKTKGSNKLGVAVLKRKLYGLVVEKDVDYFEKEGTKPTGVEVDTLFNEYILETLNDTPEKEKESSRLEFQRKIVSSFMKITKNYPEVRTINFNLMQKYVKRTVVPDTFLAPFVKKKDETEGSGMKQKRKMIGRGLTSEEVKADKYLKLGKYKANKEKLLGGKLQIRSENENQVNNVKSQMISKNIRDILLKINKKEIINYSDVDKLDENEKNDLYNIGKKLHITELFEIPSTLKNQEEKLKDEFFKLRGSIMAGNNSPEILKKFKMILIKMKNNKMISLSEFNEILNIFLEMDY